ncbi:MAG: hypothetical protein HY867_05750 [Chloroflexi bacterium]|nr:hypothetical protein [Chloroflexota bacterium]
MDDTWQNSYKVNGIDSTLTYLVKQSGIYDGSGAGGGWRRDGKVEYGIKIIRYSKVKNRHPNIEYRVSMKHALTEYEVK